MLGFSLGGDIAQEPALPRPRRLVRRIVLTGTAPQGAPHIRRDQYATRFADHVKALLSGG